jgi:hypothetical protein
MKIFYLNHFRSFFPLFDGDVSANKKLEINGYFYSVKFDFLKFVNIRQKSSKILKIPNLCLFFVWIQQFSVLLATL